MKNLIQEFKYSIIFGAVIAIMLPLTAQNEFDTVDADEILNFVDNNAIAENRKVEATMVIHGRRSSRNISMRSWIVGEDKSFTEYLAPARDAGTKMLKLEDQLWTFSPQADRIIKIAGHMLRQSLNGSDISYEDMLEDSELRNYYTAEITGIDTLIERPCWIVSLTGKVNDLAYPTRKIWVDQEYYIILMEERFAKSGTLLKTTKVTDIFKINDRWYPKKIVFKDVLKSGKGTEFIIDEIEFDIEIPPYLFTKASLK